MNKPRVMLATLALLGASVLPSAAFAQTARPYPYVQLPVQCAVGYIAGPERVAVTMISTNDQQLIDVDANICTNFISGGDWAGIDNQGSWSPGMHIVAIAQPMASADMDMNIWATPDSRSVGMGIAMAQQLEQSGQYYVAYPNS
jgi:hypothetical protein